MSADRNNGLTLRAPSRETAGATVTRKLGIDHTLVYGDLLFTTHGDRCRYIGMSSAEKARWREQEKGKFHRISDVQQEPQLGPLDDIAAAPIGLNRETSSPDIQKHGDNDGNDSLVGHRSPPYQPTSLTAPAKETLPSGSRQTELLPRAGAPTTETGKPKTRVTPLKDACRRGTRQVEKQKRPAKHSKGGRKLSQERMRIFLDALAEYPILGDAAAKAGIHPKNPAYWRKCSEAGHDGYDIVWRGEQARFHEHYRSAIDVAHGELEFLVWQKAMGITYKTDPFLVDLGCKGSDAYARDENGKPIEDGPRRPNSKMLRFYLEWKLPEKYGKRRKRDIPHSGGVLIIGEPKKPEINNAASIKSREWKSISRKLQGLKG
jgi:hypothetical protein